MSFNNKELKKFKQELEGLSKDYNKYIKGFLTEMGQRAYERTKKRTPVDTGYLKANWYLSDVYRKSDTELYIVLYNLAEYASHVEYGHLQEPGRFVPAIGKRLKAGFVEGRYMATISIAEIEKEIPKRYKEALRSFLVGKGYKYLK